MQLDVLLQQSKDIEELLLYAVKHWGKHRLILDSKNLNVCSKLYLMIFVDIDDFI